MCLKLRSLPKGVLDLSPSASFLRYRPKGVFGKGVGNSKNASEMRQNYFKNASKMRGTPLGENTFWTIPISGILNHCVLN